MSGEFLSLSPAAETVAAKLCRLHLDDGEVAAARKSLTTSSGSRIPLWWLAWKHSSPLRVRTGRVRSDTSVAWGHWRRSRPNRWRLLCDTSILAAADGRLASCLGRCWMILRYSRPWQPSGVVSHRMFPSVLVTVSRVSGNGPNSGKKPLSRF